MATICRATDAEIPVDGDRDLLTQLIAAEKTNLEALKRGRMRVKTSWTQHFDSGAPQTGATGEATALWDGDRQRWEYSAKVDVHDPTLGHSHENKDVVFIKTPAEIISYVRDRGDGRGQLTVRPASKRNVGPIFGRARPPKWFVFGGHDRGNWSEYFDPDDGKRSQALTGIQIRREGNRVVVQRSHSNDASFRIEASLSQGGNVVQYEKRTFVQTDGEVAGRLDTGDYQWARDGAGVWHLKNCHYQGAPLDDPERIKWQFDLEVLEFTSTPEIRDFDFDKASIEFDVDDRIEIRSR